jgi:ABC-2 type transport system ATP-binding protein
VLFLDEPTSGVDPGSRRRFWNLIHDMSAEGVSVLVSTHYMDEAEYCMRIALIAAGRLIALGAPHELKQRSMGFAGTGPQGALPTMEDMFVHLVQSSRHE